MSKHFSERILEHIRKPGYQGLKLRRLAHAMGIGDEEYGEFREAVDALRRVGRVLIGGGNAILPPQAPPQVIGTYRANPRGFGFVVPDEPTAHGDMFIPPGDSLDALTGDKVLCRLVSRGKRDGKPSFGGQIIEVLERGKNRYVGQLQHEGEAYFVVPDGNALHVPILIADVGAKGARAGEQVVVEIVRYPKDGKPAHGVILERLGRRGDKGVDLMSVARQHGLPAEFPATALADARLAIEAFDPAIEAQRREDLSETLVITIDPATARDFDDAISLRRLDSAAKAESVLHRKGHRSGKPIHGGKQSGGHGGGDGAAWELGVHIADVSFFVRPGGGLDEEAVERGTSVYFPGHVIPMLPEILSNGVCSLQEGEPRLCKSAFIRYDAEGRVTGARFASTLIRSAKRLTYEQASGILEGKVGRIPKPVVDLMKDMDTLARAIRKRRLAEGMVVLDLPEVELEFDDEERVVDAHPADTSFSHTIIEMFMVEANEAVARHLRALGAPFLRRIHPDPDAESAEGVARFLRAAGHPIPKRFTHADLQALLEEVRGKPESYAVSLAVLKSMETAEYSPKDIGHFALASDCYAHFTSPIRRYPDLMIHRLLQSSLDGELARGRFPASHPNEDQLQEWGRRMSFLSRRAESAEREYKTLKVLQLLGRHVGETFDGVITGVAQFGLFVQYPKYLIDGLIRLEDLGDDWWDVDVKTGRVRGERSRRTFALGQVVTAQIASVDLPSRQLNLSLPRKQSAGSGGAKVEEGGRQRGDHGAFTGRGRRGGDSGRAGGQAGSQGGGKGRRGRHPSGGKGGGGGGSHGGGGRGRSGRRRGRR